jgi:alkylation response protein AidB-like acyl-CoA dehydrogenase
MNSYYPPVGDMRFVIEEIAGLADVAALPGYGEATPDLVAQILDEAAKFASEVLAPLNRPGDVEGSRLENGVVRTPPGFAEAYGHFVESGWNAVPFEPEHGGQGLPWTVAIALQEMWNAANMSFALCPLLTQGAVELLQVHGSEAQRSTYLAPLIEGRWTGTMNLTEPQAGTDLGAIRTRAVRDGAGYRVIGQKIFITYGEHDFAENIVHMVLARSPDGPPGVKGLSLFIVPKFLPDAEGRPGQRNDLRVLSLEHKLGINASPTCVMSYGESGGARAYLVGEENRGVEYMFTMMNNARLSVGVQGLAIAERAYQQARAFAEARVQSRAAGAGKEAVPIIRHPDVRRMLMTMRSLTDAMRGLVYDAAGTLDRAKRHPDPAERARCQARVDLLIPVVKGWCTDQGVIVASLGIQIHGGMGFIEETGAAQHLRDARIAPIYEGTNGIQANDLAGRKLMRDDGAAARALFAEIETTLRDLDAAGVAGASIARELGAALHALRQATDWLLDAAKRDVDQALAGASPYLALFGIVAGGWTLARQAGIAARRLAAAGSDGRQFERRMASARFFAENLLPAAAGLAAQVIQGGPSTLAFTAELFTTDHS